MNRILSTLAKTMCCFIASFAFAAPDVTSIDTFDTTNTSLANTTEFKTAADPRLVIRRAQKYYFVITTNKDAPQSAWNIFPSAKRTWDDTGVAILPAPGLPPFPDDDWYFKVSPGFVGLDTQEFLLEISIPKDAEIGTYEFRIDALVTSAEGGGRIPGIAIQKVFPKKVVVLFNPWKANDTVYMPDAKDRKEYIQNEDGNLILAGPSEFAWKFNQFDEVSLNVLNYFLDETPGLDRTTPIDVSREIAGGCNWRDWSQGVLEGRWAKTFPGGEKPDFWKSSKQVFEKWLSAGPPYSPVKYGQCWVFSGISTTLLRTAGIPARPVSSFKTAIDNSNPVDGHIDDYYTYNAFTMKYRRNFALETDNEWNYHVWTECWMNRPDLSGGDGWQVIDATSQAEGAALTRIGPASREIIRAAVAPPASDHDAGFMWSSALADKRIFADSKATPGIYVVAITDNNAKAKFGEHIWTKKRGAAGRDDIAAEYRPAGPRPAPSEGERLTNPYFTVLFNADDSANVGADVTGTVTIINGPDDARTFYVSFGAALYFYNGDLIDILSDPDWPAITLNPNQSIDLPLTIPGGQIAPQLSPTPEYVRFFGAVNCDEIGVFEPIPDGGDGGGVGFLSPSLQISLSPPGPIGVNGVSSGIPAYTNTSGLTLTDVQLVWTLSSQLTFGGSQTLTVPLPDLLPNGSIAPISAPFYAVSIGTGTVSASLECSQLAPSLANATIKVVSCAGDLNGDSVVDDDDFVIFYHSYTALDCESPDMEEGCPGDLTSDGFVDESDFEIFAAAYDHYFCDPPPGR
ncbi:MAG: transglutaminase domain-containing protein [Phycisphaeraceae bacterium]|nr:transglutaminase domain-containing protein [Phycisphaeraceae bacterium]